MAITVTCTQGGQTFNGTILVVKVLTGAVEAGGASTAFQTGITGPGPAQGSITPNFTNSLPVFSISEDSTATAFTAAANNTFYDNSTDLGGAFTAHGFYSGTVTAGTPITVGSSAPTGSFEFGWAVYEVPPAGGTTPVVDGSSPALVNAPTAITATTASFTPPPGSVLVAIISCFSTNSGGSVTMSVTGGGLTWTQRAGNSTNPQSEGSFIFTATVPVASAAVQLYAPGWHPGRGLPGMPGGTPFYVPPEGAVSSASAAATGGPPVYPLHAPVRAQRPADRNWGRTGSRNGVFSQTGPPVRPPRGPVRAQPATPVLAGRTSSRRGILGVTGPPAHVWHGPVQARLPGPVLTGRTAGRDGVLGVSGPVLRPPDGPVQAKIPPARNFGRTASRAGTFTAFTPQAGPPVRPPSGPVQAKQPPGRTLGRTSSRTGVFTAGGPQAGPPVYPPRGPVQAKVPLGRNFGRALSRRGPAVTSGPPVRPPQGPVTSRRPPLGRTGRTQGRAGPYGGTGPPAVRSRRPVCGQPQKPVLTGRTAWRTGAYTAPFVAPFTIGALTATDKATSALTAAGASAALTASTTASTATGTYVSDLYVTDIYGGATVTAGVLSSTVTATGLLSSSQGRGGPS